MAYFKINGADFSSLVSGLKVGFETLVSDNSGRNAAGDTVIDVVNKKVKLYVTLRHTTEAEMRGFLNAIEGYVVNVSYLNPKTNKISTISAYTGTPEPEYYTIQANNTIYKPLTLNFIQL
jgi:uncharacterized protein YbbC (DUF1343 family)